MNIPPLLQLVLLLVAGGYLAGSIPFGLVLARLAGLGDIRRVGSGNTGATNVLRTGRKDIALLTLLLDGAKGAAAVLYVATFGDLSFPLIVGLAAVLGHCFPIWLLFRGGKGVATGLGVILAWHWPVGLACCATWLATAALTRRSSAAGLAAFVLAPALMAVFTDSGTAFFTLFVSLIVVARHHANIRRLIQGTEPRIGAAPVSPAP